MDNVVRMPYTSAERNALAIYVVAARDVLDAMEMLNNESNPVTLSTLHLMVNTPNPNLGENNARINEAFEPLVRRRCEELGIAIDG